MLLRRAILWFVAFMPVVWGNCPYWFVGYPPGDAREAATSTVKHCPCCRDKVVQPHGPVAPVGCDGDCPMTIARRGATPLGACVTAPPAEAFFLGCVLADADASFSTAPEPVRIVRPPGPPPDDPSSTVLLI